MTDYSRYMVTFSSDAGPDVSVLHGEDPVVPTGGYGGWTAVQRERRISLTQWTGKDPLGMDIPVLFDGVRDGSSQELAISALSRMALPALDGSEPPIIRISGLAIPKLGPTQWVIANIQWGKNVIWDTSRGGVTGRMRQDAVVQVLQYVADDRVAFKNVKLASASTGKSKAGWPKTYIVVAGDTLQKIAARKNIYGNSTKWKKIADANGIRDSKSLKRGQSLRIPAP